MSSTVDLASTLHRQINSITDSILKEIVGDLLNGKIEEQICGVSILIDIEGSKMKTHHYLEYLKMHNIEDKEKFYEIHLEESYLPEEICCDCSVEAEKYIRFMRKDAFLRKFGREKTLDLAIDTKKVETIMAGGWSGNFSNSKEECVWVTVKEAYTSFIEKMKLKNDNWSEDIYFLSNLTWDYCGLRRYSDYLTPEDSLTEEVVCIEYPDDFAASVMLFQPNATVGYFTPLSFYVSADGLANKNFGRTFCPYNVEASGKERVHKQYSSARNFSVRSVGKIHYDKIINRDDDTAINEQMKLILDEAVNRLKQISVHGD